MKNKNILIMYLISFFQGMIFYASISTIYRTSRGLTLSEYALIDSITFIFTLVMEMPWGVIADKIGYKKTMLLANGFYLISKFVFLNAHSFFGFLMERVLFAIAVSGLSGVDISILYLSVDQDKSQKVFSRYAAFNNAGVLIAAAIFSLFALSHYQTALYTLIAYAIGFGLNFLLTEVKNEEEKDKRLPFMKVLTDSLKDYRFLLFILGTALCSVATWVIIVFLNQEQYISCGGNERFIGMTFVISGLMNFSGMLSADLTKKLGDRRSGYFLITGMIICALSLSFARNLYLSFILIAMTDVFYSMYTPLINRMESDHVKISDRATQISIYMMISDLVSVIPDVLLGKTAEMSLPLTFRLCALLLVVSGLTFSLGLKNSANN